MAALTKQRNTRALADGDLIVGGVEASTKIYLGSLVGRDAAGYLVPAQSALTIVGRAEYVLNGIPGADADNSAGAAAAIELVVKRKGLLSFDINAGDITVANEGRLAYAVDDHTVSSSSNGGTRPVAGRIVKLDPDGGVFVDCSDQAGPGIEPGTLLTLVAAGVAAAGPITLAGAVVGQRLLAVFGTLTAGGPLINKVPGTDFESVISVAGQIQQLAAADLHLDTFIFVLGTK